jgi:RNA recognition motif-containing protein
MLAPWIGVFNVLLFINVLPICDCNNHILILTVEGHSIYIRNLPFSMTAEQLEVEFKKYGPIKQGGIQVRNNKVGFKCIKCIENIISVQHFLTWFYPSSLGGFGYVQQQGYCFGFVEFQSLSSVNSAIQVLS